MLLGGDQHLPDAEEHPSPPVTKEMPSIKPGDAVHKTRRSLNRIAPRRSDSIAEAEQNTHE